MGASDNTDLILYPLKSTFRSSLQLTKRRNSPSNRFVTPALSQLSFVKRIDSTHVHQSGPGQHIVAGDAEARVGIQQVEEVRQLEGGSELRGPVR